MKRSPLKRSTKPIPRKREEPRRSSRVLDDFYLELVREQPCCARHLGTCVGDIEAHHMGKRGLGMKSDDTDAVPFCRGHHRAWHDATGDFYGKNHAWRAGFGDSVVVDTQRRLRLVYLQLVEQTCRYGYGDGSVAGEFTSCQDAGISNPCRPCRARASEWFRS